MDTLSYKTRSINKENADKKWWLVDAEGQTLGRLSSQIATLLRGKHKTNFTPHADCGDYVVVINARDVRLTGNKAEQKQYFRHSGYMGGERFIPFKTMIERYPERVIEKAVKGMLPKNKLGRHMLKKLKVYAGADHPHAAQQPKPFPTYL